MKWYSGGIYFGLRVYVKDFFKNMRKKISFLIEQFKHIIISHISRYYYIFNLLK